VCGAKAIRDIPHLRTVYHQLKRVRWYLLRRTRAHPSVPRQPPPGSLDCLHPVPGPHACQRAAAPRAAAAARIHPFLFSRYLLRHGLSPERARARSLGMGSPIARGDGVQYRDHRRRRWTGPPRGGGQAAEGCAPGLRALVLRAMEKLPWLLGVTGQDVVDEE